jgi:hypothetical protein
MHFAAIPQNVLSFLIAPSTSSTKTDNSQPQAVPTRLVSIANRAAPVAPPAGELNQTPMRTPTVADMRQQWETRGLIAPAPTLPAASAASALHRATATTRARARTQSTTTRLAKFNPVRFLAQVLRKVHNPVGARDTPTVVEVINPVVTQRWQPTLVSAAQAMAGAPDIFPDGGNEWEAWDDADYSAEEQRTFDERFEREDRQMAALRSPASRSSKPPIGPKPTFIDGVWRATSPRTH